MSAIAQAEGLTPTMGQSPFAIARGVTFERELLRDDAKRLREGLVEEGILPSEATGYRDLRLRMNSGPMPDLDTAYAETSALLEATAQGGPESLGAGVPTIIASATTRIPGQPVMLPEGMLAIDALVARAGEGGMVELVVGEVKSYPYRAGHTDVQELATSRAQAGLYKHALELALAEAGLDDRLKVAAGGFLVLSRHGSNVPTVLASEDLEHQAARAESGFDLLRRAAKELETFDPADPDEALKRVESAPIDYRPECISFCDRAPRCRKDAESEGDGSILGEDVGRFLGEVGLSRAIELMNGAPPDLPTERDLVARLNAVSTQETS